MDDVTIRIAEVYVPAGRRGEVKPDVVAELAESILEEQVDTSITRH